MFKQIIPKVNANHNISYNSKFQKEYARFADAFFTFFLKADALFCVLFLYVPIVFLIIYSFSASKIAIVLEGFSFGAYQRLFANPAVFEALTNTLLLGITSTLVSTILGTCLAFYLERSASKLKKLVFPLVHLPLVLPELVMSVGLLFFLARFFRPTLAFFGIEFGSFPAVLVGHVAFSIAYVVVVVRVRLQEFDKKYEEAASDLGATNWQIFTRIVLPWLEPALISGALLSFAISIDDFYVSYFVSVGGTGFKTLPVYLFTLQSRQGVTTDLNALASLLLFISFTLIGIAAFFQHKSMANVFGGKKS